MNDYINALDDLKIDDELDDYDIGYNDAISDVITKLSELPPAQQEIKPIDYRDCVNAMMRMWIDNVITDSEYNRIMDKLHKHWGMQRG